MAQKRSENTYQKINTIFKRDENNIIMPDAEFVKKGFKSAIAENKDYDAKGLVLKAPNGLMTRRGERIVFKIKTCDFVKYRNKYGEYKTPIL